MLFNIPMKLVVKDSSGYSEKCCFLAWTGIPAASFSEEDSTDSTFVLLRLVSYSMLYIRLPSKHVWKHQLITHWAATILARFLRACGFGYLRTISSHMVSASQPTTIWGAGGWNEWKTFSVAAPMLWKVTNAPFWQRSALSFLCCVSITWWSPFSSDRFWFWTDSQYESFGIKKKQKTWGYLSLWLLLIVLLIYF